MCENTKKKARSIEMVTGSLWKNIFLFSIPLMCSQLLEVVFNLSDVAVVGRFADYKALGAVGSTTLLVTLFVGFLIVPQLPPLCQSKRNELFFRRQLSKNKNNYSLSSMDLYLF